MTRAVWLFRIIGIVIFLICGMLMLNLYSKLTRLSHPTPPVTGTAR